MAVAHSLYIDRSNFNLVLVDNDTGTPFLTGDQPIINLQHTHAGKPPEKFELYYPLSPTKAMFFVESSNKRGDFPFSAVSVNNYNMMIVKNSHEQVFSNSEQYLRNIDMAGNV